MIIFIPLEQATCNYNTEKNANIHFNVQHLLDCSSNTQGTKASGGFFDRTSAWVITFNVFISLILLYGISICLRLSKKVYNIFIIFL